MCTVTAVPMRGGFRVACNRDEQECRPVALSPQRHQVSPRTAVFPVDPASGGTWLGVNDTGLTLAVLNRNDPGSSRQRLHARRSRGLIVPSLLCHALVADVLDAINRVDWSDYEPFRLCAVDRGAIGIVSSDGHEVTIERHRFERPVMWTSSGLGDALVAWPRARLFEEMVLAHESSWLAGQAGFHAHQWPNRPHLSVVMQREGARTVSRSVIEVSENAIRFDYEPILDPLRSLQ